jgi:hypothetical protein
MKYKEIDLAKGAHYSQRERANFIGEERFAKDLLDRYCRETEEVICQVNRLTSSTFCRGFTSDLRGSYRVTQS